MRRRLLLLVCVVFCSSSAFADEPKPYKIDDIRDKLVVMSAGKDRHVIVAPDYYNGRDNFFYGVAGKFYWVPIVSSGSDGKKFSFTFWDPRVVNGMNSRFFSEGGVHKIRCADRVTTLKQLSAEDSRKIIDKGKFFDRLWKRRSFLLARDERGTYYFVDRGRKTNSRNFRVYVGPRGKMKRMRMKNIVYDSEGAIFSTVKGDLRLVLNKEASWIRGNKRTKLTYLPKKLNRELIYLELGPYVEARLGTPCDDL